MSLGDAGPLGTCTDGGLRQAICTSVAAGITYIAAAGNSSTDAADVHPCRIPRGRRGLRHDRLGRRARRRGGLPVRLPVVRQLLRRRARPVQQLRPGRRCRGSWRADLLVVCRRRLPEPERDEHGVAACRGCRSAGPRRECIALAGAGRRCPAPEWHLSGRVARRRGMSLELVVGERSGRRHRADGQRIARGPVRDWRWWRGPAERRPNEPRQRRADRRTGDPRRDRVRPAGHHRCRFPRGWRPGRERQLLAVCGLMGDRPGRRRAAHHHRPRDRWRQRAVVRRPFGHDRSSRDPGRLGRRVWLGGLRAGCLERHQRPGGPARRVADAAAGRPLPVRAQRRGALGRERDRDRAPPGGRLGRRPGPAAARLPVRLQRSPRRLRRRLRHDRSPSDGDRR